MRSSRPSRRTKERSPRDRWRDRRKAFGLLDQCLSGIGPERPRVGVGGRHVDPCGFRPTSKETAREGSCATPDAVPRIAEGNLGKGGLPMRRIVALVATVLLVGALGSVGAASADSRPKLDVLGRSGANTAPASHWCNTNGLTCTEPYQNWEEFPWFDDVERTVNIQEYIGHDEPSLLFYSNTPGSG